MDDVTARELWPPGRVSDRFQFSFLCRLVSENSLVPRVAALSALNLEKETGGLCAQETLKTDDLKSKAFRAKDSPEKVAILPRVFQAVSDSSLPLVYLGGTYTRNQEGPGLPLTCVEAGSMQTASQVLYIHMTSLHRKWPFHFAEWQGAEVERKMQPVNYTDISFLGSGFNLFYQTAKQAWFWWIKKNLVCALSATSW